MDKLDQVAAETCVLACPAADGTDFDVRVIGIGVFHFVVGAGSYAIKVADTGPGLAEEDRERVFERFYRTDTSRTRASGGSGLGLSIVAALVAAHGGTVDVDSEVGRGATFRVLLPRRQVD